MKFKYTIPFEFRTLQTQDGGAEKKKKTRNKEEGDENEG